MNRPRSASASANALAAGAMVLAGLLASVPVAADPQSVIGSRIPRKEAGVSRTQLLPQSGSMRAGFNALGRCMAELFEPAARRALAHPYGGEQQAKAVGRILEQARWRSGDCTSASIETSGSVEAYAGAFAEFFLRHRFGQAQVDALAADQSEGWSAARLVPRTGDEHFSACIVAAAAPQIYALVETIPDSGAEQAALAPIIEVLSPCITQGQEVAFTPAGLRSTLAVSLFQALSDYSEYTQDAG